MAARSKSTSPSCAAARMCSTVFVEPPMATSSAIAFSNAARVAMLRGSALASSWSYQRRHRSMTVRPASRNNSRRAACVASVDPLPGRASPRASVRQFIEFAVNMPEHEPQVGQADRSTSVSPESSTCGDAEAEIAVIRSVGACATPSTTTALPASIGPPETNTVGMFSRIAAFSIPGVILSQFEMHTSASAACPLTMYSTASAITSRRGQRVEHPAVAHRDAVVHGDRVELPRHPARLTDRAGDEVADVLEVHVTGHELRVGVRDRDDRAAEVVVAHAGGAPEGAGSGGVAAVGGHAGTKGRHVGLQPGRAAGVGRCRVWARGPGGPRCRDPRYALRRHWRLRGHPLCAVGHLVNTSSCPGGGSSDVRSPSTASGGDGGRVRRQGRDRDGRAVGGSE